MSNSNNRSYTRRKPAKSKNHDRPKGEKRFKAVETSKRPKYRGQWGEA